nr:uncharacterized protein LOC109785192 [Aegilops tauschii subsp. strangulata]
MQRERSNHISPNPAAAPVPHAVADDRAPPQTAAMMDGAAGAGQAPERRTRRVAAPRGQPLSPRRTAHRLGGPSGLPPMRGASAAVRAGDRAAGPVVRSGRGLCRPGAGFEPPSMDFSQLGCVLLWIRARGCPKSSSPTTGQWSTSGSLSRFGLG